MRQYENLQQTSENRCLQGRVQLPTGGKVRVRKLNRWNSGTDSKADLGMSLDERRCVRPPTQNIHTWKA